MFKNILEQTIVTAAKGLAQKDFSAVELTETYLRQATGLNQTFNAYITISENQALDMARASDERRAQGQELGILDGIPCALKDNILFEGVRATGGSKILENYLAPYDASATTRLKAQGVVCVGKTNMDEFAMGSSTEHSAYGPTKHPSDLERVPGGSSGGSACAVAADMCVAALGSDTGGSIRQPAAFCGIVGFKPSYGRVSRYGLMAMASSLDQIGPLTKTVEDAHILFNALHGHDAFDQTTRHFVEGAMAFPTQLKGVRIGLPREAWGDGMTTEVRTQVEQGVQTLRALGAEIVDVDLPYSKEALAVYYILMPCEVSANLSRYDGIRYGVRESAKNLMDTYTHSRAQGIGAEAQRRILLGTYALSKGYYEAYYHQACKVQKLIQKAYAQAFSQVDILLTPTAPSVAFKQGEKTSDPLTMYLEDIFTVGVNVAGLPAISVPCDTEAGLPVGMQFIGGHGQDYKVLDVAYAFEQAQR